MLNIKTRLFTDYGGKSCCLIVATLVDALAVEVQGVEGKNFCIPGEIML